VPLLGIGLVGGGSGVCLLDLLRLLSLLRLLIDLGHAAL
jgi:hypothetical protein